MASNSSSTTSDNKGIAFDVSTELSKRIVGEARESDKLTVVAYMIRDEVIENTTTIIPCFMAWRYRSSPRNVIHVRSGDLDTFTEPFPVTSAKALDSFINPPFGHQLASDEIIYVVLSGEHTVPEKELHLTKSVGDSNKQIRDLFPKRSMISFSQDDDEQFVFEQIPDFVWNLLS